MGKVIAELIINDPTELTYFIVLEWQKSSDNNNIIIIITRPLSPLATSFPRHRVDEPRQWCRRRGLDGLGMSIDCLVWRLWGDCAPVPALIYRNLEIQRCVLHPNFRTPNRERGPVTIIRLRTQVKILRA